MRTELNSIYNQKKVSRVSLVCVHVESNQVRRGTTGKTGGRRNFLDGQGSGNAAAI